MIRRRTHAAGESWRKFEPQSTEVRSSSPRAWFLVLCCLTGAEFALAIVLVELTPLLAYAALLAGLCFLVVARRVAKTL